MLDKDLSSLYQVGTRDLNKAVSRNLERFPEDFMFQLTSDELKNLMFHFGTSSWGGTRKRPRVFTEHGILMLSSVLKNRRAVFVNIAIMRTFVKLRNMLAAHRDLSQKLNELEHKIEKHDHEIRSIFEAVRELLKEPEKPKRRIGFQPSDLDRKPVPPRTGTVIKHPAAGADYGKTFFGVLRYLKK